MSAEECTLSNVTVMKGNRVGTALSLALSAACILGFTYVSARYGLPHGKEGGAFVRVMVYGVLGGAAGAWWFSRVSRKPSEFVGELRATANGIYLRGKRLVARREISKAYLWPGVDGDAYVRVERHGLLAGPIDLKVKNVEEGRALLHAIGMDATQATSSFTAAATSLAQYRQRILTTWAGCACAIGAPIAMAAAGRHGAVFGLTLLLAVLAYGAFALNAVKSASVVVGADGVYLRWMWQKQFIPIQDIARAEVVWNQHIGVGMYGLVVRIHRKSGGDPVDVLVQRARSALAGPSAGIAKLSRNRAEAIAERINEAVLGKGRGTSSALAAADLELLSRGERAVDEWVASLRGLRAKIATFREQATGGLDALWSVLEDVEAGAEQRAAAAVALSPHLDEGGRARLRIAAQATVAPKLRIALEAAAEDDDERLVRALEDVADARAPEARAAEA
jgi:hypothetical protein